MASQNRLYDDFFAEHYAYARAAGLPDIAARLAAVQASLESNWGRSAPGDNYHGIQARKEAAADNERVRQEASTIQDQGLVSRLRFAGCQSPRLGKGHRGEVA